MENLEVRTFSLRAVKVEEFLFLFFHFLMILSLGIFCDYQSLKDTRFFSILSFSIGIPVLYLIFFYRDSAFSTGLTWNLIQRFISAITYISFTSAIHLSILETVDEEHPLYWAIFVLTVIFISFCVLGRRNIATVGLILIIIFSASPYINEHTVNNFHLSGLTLSVCLNALLLANYRRESLIQYSPFHLPLFIFTIVFIISTILSIYPYAGVLNLELYARYIAIFFLIEYLVRENYQIRRIALLLLAISLIISVVVLWELGVRVNILGLSEGILFRVWPFDTPPNYFVFTILISFPFGLALLSESGRLGISFLITGILIFLAVAVYFSYARIALVALIIELIIFYLLKSIFIKRVWIDKTHSAIFISILAIIFAIAVLYTPQIIRQRFAEVLDPNKIYRLTVWKSALPIARDYPIFGPGTSTKRYLLRYYSIRQNVGAKEQYLFDAHSTPIELITSIGITGTFAFLYLAIMYLYLGLKSIKLSDDSTRTWLIALISISSMIFIDGLVNYRLWVYDNGYLIFVCAGIVSAISIRNRKNIKINIKNLSVYRWFIYSFLILSLFFSGAIHLGKRFVRLGREAVLSQNINQAKKYFFQAIHIEPINAHHWYLLAIWERTYGDMDKAIEYMEKAVRLNPMFAFYRDVLGQLYMEQNQLEKAKNEFDTAIKLVFYDSSGQFRLHRGVLYLKKKEKDKALNDFAWAIFFRQSLLKMDFFQNGLGKGLIEDVLAVMEKMAGISSSNQPFNYVRALDLSRAYQILGRYSDEARILGRIRIESPGDYDSAIYLARALQRLGKFNEAQNQLQIALLLKPNFPTAYSEMGILFFNQNNYLDAVPYFLKAIKHRQNLVLDDIVSHFYLWKCYEKLGNNKKASKEKEKVDFIKADLPHQKWDAEMQTVGENPELSQIFYYGF